MCKKACFSVLLIIFVILPNICIYAQDVPDKVTIDIIKEKKAEVTFEHKKHIKEYSISCTECHHTYRPEEGDPKPCIECHDFAERKIIDGRWADLIKTSVMKNVYHSNCNPCHDKLQRGGKPFPKKCSVCHPIRIE